MSLQGQIDKVKKIDTSKVHAAFNNGYIKIKLTLPMSDKEQEYLVKKENHNYILNGDIIVATDLMTTKSYSSDEKNFKWPNAEIPVLLSESLFLKNKQDMVYKAINIINQTTKLSIVPKTNQKDFILIKNDDSIAGAGLSRVGRQGGEQELSIKASKASVGTVIHEILHAAGFWHEQSRKDRDDFVRINTSNISENEKHNFQIEPGNPQGSYDYVSIMHYPSTAFSKNGETTIDCKNNGKIVPCDPMMGQRSSLSNEDISGISNFYNEVKREPSNYVFDPPTFAMKSICSVSRKPNAMENWWVDRDGQIHAGFWYEGLNWNQYQRKGYAEASPLGGITAISRKSPYLEYWYIGKNGSVQGAAWSEDKDWFNYELAPANSAATTSGMASVSRKDINMEVWWIGSDGSVQGAYKTEGEKWSRYELAPANSASTTSSITALSRKKNYMEIWWVGANGSVQGAFWLPDKNWTRYQVAPANSASLLGGISAVSRKPDAMELFWLGKNGSVQGAYFYEGKNWNLYELAPANSASIHTGISSVSRNPNTMEVWWIGQNGSVESSFWYEGKNWSRYQLASEKSASTSGGITSLSRNPKTMEVWYIGANNSIQGKYWYEGNNWKSYQLAKSK